MKRGGPLRRRKPLRKRNPDRRARLYAQQYGPQADLARSLPCCVCGKQGPSDPDHVRTKGAGGRDRGNIVPLCRVHHTEKGAKGIAWIMEAYGVDLWSVARDLERKAYP